MKKLLSLFVGGMAIAALTVPAMSIVLTPEQGQNVPNVFAKVAGGNVVYDSTITAYSSKTFNKILQAYGLELTPEMVGAVPTSYATMSNGQVVFNNVPIAYDPPGYHAIFTAYGLELTPEAVADILKSNDYASVVGDKIVFGKAPTAYDGPTLALILKAYNLAVPAVVEIPVADPKPAAEPEPVKWVLNTGYMFDFDKAVIKEHYYVLLDYIVEAMETTPTLRFEIQGHTCSIGSKAYNQKLSERRAKAINDYLVLKGIDQSRLTAVGFGEEKPAFSNDTEEERAKNRRVELVEF